MNIGELKAAGNEQVRSPAADKQAMRQQMRQSMRDWAMEQVQLNRENQAANLQDKLTSQTKVGAKVYANAMSLSVSVGDQSFPVKDKYDAAKLQEKNESLFDFEEVAGNVLKFVGGHIKHALAKGADESTLKGLFEQARSGVLKGVKMAEEDLAGFMSDDIEQGITKSQKLIEDGLQALYDSIFGETDSEQEQQDSVEGVLLAQSIEYSSVQSGELSVTTADGDKVTLRFEDLKAFQLNQQAMLLALNDKDAAESEQSDADENNSEQNETATSSANATSDSETESTEAADDSDADLKNVGGAVSSQYAWFEQQGISFSLQGELDEGELTALADLVGKAQDLANTFFYEDPEQAFNKALDLGFDESELTGFALQLNKQESIKVVQAYGNVSHYSEDDTNTSSATQSAKPVADYLEKMLAVFEQSQNQLASDGDYETLVNGLINQMQDVHTPDLINAINRFHQFNHRLYDALPDGVKSTS